MQIFAAKGLIDKALAIKGLNCQRAVPIAQMDKAEEGRHLGWRLRAQETAYIHPLLILPWRLNEVCPGIAVVIAQSPFDGTWLNKAGEKLPQAPISYLLNDEIFRCSCAIGNIEIKPDGYDHKTPEAAYRDTLNVQAVDSHTMVITAKKAGRPNRGTRSMQVDRAMALSSNTSAPRTHSPPNRCSATDIRQDSMGTSIPSKMTQATPWFPQDWSMHELGS